MYFNPKQLFNINDEVWKKGSISSAKEKRKIRDIEVHAETFNTELVEESEKQAKLNLIRKRRNSRLNASSTMKILVSKAVATICIEK